MEDEELERFLDGLEREELVRRLLAVARRHEDVRFGLESEAGAARGSFDLRQAKKQLTAQVAIRGQFLPPRATRAYAKEVEAAVDTLAGLLDAGLASEVVVLSEHLMRRLDTALTRVDDSDGYLAAPFDRLKELHHDACRIARPDVRALARRLVERGLDEGDGEWFLDAATRYADVLGVEGLDAYRERLERESGTLPPLGARPGRASSFRDHVRWRVTYLREQLARANGSTDELVSVLAHDLSSPYSFVRIAEELESAGREREAIAWLERGVAAYPPAGDDPRVRRRLVAAYLRDGQAADAVALLEKAFAADPGPGTYAELRAVVPDELWAERRVAALERIRTAPPQGLFGRSADRVVLAQLHEGDLAGAWLDARAGGCTWQTWLELADASRTHDPDAAVQVYVKAAENQLEHPAVPSYERAVDLLRRARETLAAAGRTDEFRSTIERLREQHARRPRLIAMLDQAGLR
jgi:tetratricopeptide (TPR) repeat protein